MSKLYFNNKNQDFNDSLKEKYIDANASKVNDKTTKWIKTELNYHIKILESKVCEMKSKSDYTVYSGSSGLALLFMDLANVTPNSKHTLLDKALGFIENKIDNLSGLLNYSFLTGDTGPLAIGAILFMKRGEKEKSMKLLNRIKMYASFVCDLQNKDISDDLMSGRAGYLYTLLYVYKNIEYQNVISTDLIKDVVETIIESGKNQASKANINNLPLCYFNYDINKEGRLFYGNLYGMTGIIYMLLQAKKMFGIDEYDDLLKETLSYLITKKLPSNNYPICDKDLNDDLVQWCHGAPSFLMLFAIAHLVFTKEKTESDTFLKEAITCADLIWERGMLIKSYGLCHGVAGNSYALLRMYQITRDEKYLHRAFAFAEYCSEFGNGNLKHAEKYISLYEGYAGVLYLLIDLLNPRQSCFPGLQIYS